MDDIVEVEHSRVVVILTGEHGLVDIRRMGVCNGVLVGIPATEAQVQTTHESDSPINKTKLLVVGPVKDHIVVHAVQPLQDILGHSREASRVQR